VILPFSIVEIRCLICGMTLRLMEISLPYYWLEDFDCIWTVFSPIIRVSFIVS
jgi:hypothetical protein